MRTKKKKISDCSRAGSLGASIRWADHVKQKTKLMRVLENDYNRLDSIRANDGSIGSCAGALTRVLDFFYSRSDSLCKKS